MSKIITFSRVYPSYHPRRGEPTYFMEKIWRSFPLSTSYYDLITLNPDKEQIAEDVWKSVLMNWASVTPKHHTIRAGNRFKAGDKFSPRVWSGKPYNSKQIVIAPDITVVSVWKFEIDQNGVYSINGKYIDEQTEYNLAMNDGLTEMDMQFWFIPDFKKWNKTFVGQVICWSENVNY
jgi:hypothetical protein